MSWTVLFDFEFEQDFQDLSPEVQDELFAHAKLLEEFGPDLGRPWVDTLQGSIHANMKELRFDAANGAWRVAFAFDLERRAVLLMAGDKSGIAQRRFYSRMIPTADKRFSRHQAELKERRDNGDAKRTTGETARSKASKGPRSR